MSFFYYFFIFLKNVYKFKNLFINLIKERDSKLTIIAELRKDIER